MMHATRTVAKALGMTIKRYEKEKEKKKKKKKRTVEVEHDETKDHHGRQQAKEHKVLSRFTQPITRHD